MKQTDLLKNLKNKGCRMTPQRKIILDILLDNQQSLTTADALLKKAKKENSAINITTVYRNLDLLDDLKLVYTRIDADGSKLYKLICHTAHHHHITCKSCGKILPLDYCPIVPQLEQMVHDVGFTLEEHSLELLGLCRDCKTKIS